MGGQKLSKTKSIKDQRDNATLLPPLPKPFHEQILRRIHPDHEQFDAKSFPFDELIPRWKGEQFDPHLMNAATGRSFHNKHHTKGEGAKKRGNFERFDFGFCLEWIDRTLDEVTFRDRCYNQFTIKSQGCYTHPRTEFREGPNMVYYRLLRGEVCNWGMLSDLQSSKSDGTKKSWTYSDWQKHAQDLAREETVLAAEQNHIDYNDIMTTRMAEFEDWWRIEEQRDKQQGGKQAATARGHSLLGTLTVRPAFMTRQVISAGRSSVMRLSTGNVFPALPRLKSNEDAGSQSLRVVNSRQRFGQNTSCDQADLETKQVSKQQSNDRRSWTFGDTAVVSSETDEESFFSRLKEGRKPRHTDKGSGGNDLVA